MSCVHSVIRLCMALLAVAVIAPPVAAAHHPPNTTRW